MMKHPKVNTYNTELMLERLIEQAQKDEHINKPIAWALYQTWKWADTNEEGSEKVGKGKTKA